VTVGEGARPGGGGGTDAPTVDAGEPSSSATGAGGVASGVVRRGAAVEIVVVGLSHHTAPLELRERLAVPLDQLRAGLVEIVAESGADEAVVLSTCNRVEVYLAARDPARASLAARGWLAGRARQPLDRHLYERSGADAVRHAFRVASSLDSMVVGEPQILGQVKEAFAAAESAGTAGALLSRCFQKAFAVAKRVRTETGIAAGSVSVSSVACELATQVFGELRGRRVALVGAGEMAEAAARHLGAEGAELVVVNRSPERAEALAREYGAQARTFEHLAAELTQADVVICSTASPRFVITRELMTGVVKARRHRLMLLVDIAVPRDVDPRVGEMENVFLYDVDQLQSVTSEHLAQRRREAEVAERIIGSEVDDFESWRRTLVLTPTITALRARFRAIVAAEVERGTRRLSGLSDEDRRTLDRMVDAIVNKLLHHPLTELRRGGEVGDGAQLIAVARRLFDLDAAPDEAVPASAPAASARSGPNRPLVAASGGTRGGDGGNA
jgi:glutamyl-tRNA reductase